MILAPSKDPAAVLDYGVEWADWLDGDTLETSTWSVSPTGLTLVSDSIVGTVARVWVAAGTAGTMYQAVNQIVTAQGRTDQRTLLIPVQER